MLNTTEDWERTSMISHNPLVTVLMPVYNGGKYLSESINSILFQTFGDFELLIINDGSTDNTLEILNVFAVHDERLRIHHQNNQGLVFALNKGIELARGKYIARIDADDIMKQNRIKEQVAVLESQQNIAVVGSWMEIINAKGTYLTKWALPYTDKNIYFETYLNGDTTIGHPCVMYRTDVIRAIGGYNVEFNKLGEDIDLWFRIELAGQTIINIPKCLTSYRLHEGQSTQQYKNDAVNSRYKALSYFLSSKLNCNINSDTAALMIPANFTNAYFNQQKKIETLYEMKFKMFELFSKNYKLNPTENNSYAYKLWVSLLPLCKLKFTNPLKVIYQNTKLYFKIKDVSFKRNLNYGNIFKN